MEPTLNSPAPNAAPTLASISPTFGAFSGGTALTLTGSGFLTGARVSLGGSMCTGLSVVSATQITCTAPSGSGTVDVVMSNDDDQSATLFAAFIYRPAPVVSAILPVQGQMGGGTTVTISGTGFVAGASVKIGGSTCTNVTVSSATQLTCKTGSRGSSGLVEVLVTNADAQAGTLSNGYTYLVGPKITSVTPAAGPTTGGTLITIAGSDFLAGATVLVGTTACGGVTVVNATTITCTTPARAAGPALVKVTNTDAQYWTQDAAYTYQTAPFISSISPSGGALAGGTTITISGTNFLAGATVAIGAQPCGTITILSSTSITCVTPLQGAGTYLVQITNADLQTSNAFNGYTYRAAPAVSAILPVGGPLAGGTGVTITGTGFLAGATVSLGGSACTSVTVVNATTITCTTSAHAGGAANVGVTNSDSQSGSFASYSYQDAPTVTSIAPASGFAAGGTAVTITGTGFASGATVSIGSTACAGVTVVNATTITCTTGAHAAGSVDVVVANSDTQSGAKSSAYIYGPQLTSIAPTMGAKSTTITLTGSGFKSGAAITVGGVPCTSSSFVNSTTMTCVTPIAGAIGLKSVVITNPDTQTHTLANAYTYLGAPVLWLKADAIASLVDGDPISSWVDSSGNANHATQSAAASKPLYRTNVVNSLPIVRFDGGDLLAATNTASLQHAGDYTALGVFYVNSASGSIVSKSDFAGGGATQYEMTFSSAVNFQAMRSFAGGDGAVGAAADSTANLAALGTWLIGGITHDYDDAAATSVSFHRNGVAWGAPVIAGKTQNATADLRVGASVDGDVAEILLYKTALSGADRAIIETYLDSKYNIP